MKGSFVGSQGDMHLHIQACPGERKRRGDPPFPVSLYLAGVPDAIDHENAE